MRRAVIVFVIFLAAAVSAIAQDLEYGKPAELKGLVKYWVDTYGDVDARDRIIEGVARELPQLVLVEDLEASEMMLTYRGTSEEVEVGATRAYNSVVIDRQTLSSGTGFVWVDAHRKPGTPRVIVSFSNAQQNKLEKNPSAKFARAFVKAYKRANGLK